MGSGWRCSLRGVFRVSVVLAAAAVVCLAAGFYVLLGLGAALLSVVAPLGYGAFLAGSRIDDRSSTPEVEGLQRPPVQLTPKAPHAAA